MKRLVFTVVGLIGCGLVSAVAEEFEVKPVGMQIVWDVMKEEFGGFGTMNAQENGVTVSIAATTNGKKIVSFDDDDCKLTKFVDSKGKALEGEVGPFEKVSEDGKVLRFDIESEQLPSEGATGFEIEGELVIDVASKSDVVKTETAEFAKGKTVTFGEVLKTSIKEVGKPDYGDMKAEITLEAKQEWPPFAAIRFYDAEGKEIESKQGGSSRFSMLGSVKESRTYRLASKPESFYIEMEVWTDLESLTVPFAVNAGLGK